MRNTWFGGDGGRDERQVHVIGMLTAREWDAQAWRRRFG